MGLRIPFVPFVSANIEFYVDRVPSYFPAAVASSFAVAGTYVPSAHLLVAQSYSTW